jgi:hypothetical protein
MRTFGILKPFPAHSLEPIRYNEGKRKKRSFIFIFSGQCIRHDIVFALLVNDIIVISKELSHPFLLFLGGNVLFQKVLEALMVCLNLEALLQKIQTPQLNSMHNRQHLFFINGFAQIIFRQLLASEGQRSTLLHKDNTNSFS